MMLLLHMMFSRVKAILPSLLSFAEEIDTRSTAAFGLAHIIASLTITNKELRARALAEKGISPEQFDQIQKLQQIQNVKDDNGNQIEEIPQVIFDSKVTLDCMILI